MTPEILEASKTAPEAYESPQHFACVFVSEIEPDTKAKLRPVRKTKATIGAMQKAVENGLVEKSTATLAIGEGAKAVAAYVVKSAALEAELWPYVEVM